MRDDLENTNFENTNRVMNTSEDSREPGFSMGLIGAVVAIAAIVGLMIAFSGPTQSPTSTASNEPASTSQPAPRPAPATPSTTGQAK